MMHAGSFVSLSVTLLLASGCSSGGTSDVPLQPSPPPAPESSITLVTNGVVYTADDSRSVAEAFAVDDGEIIAVGSNVEIEALDEPGATRIDLEGRFVLPGIHDVHVHILEGNSPVIDCMVQPGVPPTQLIPMLRQCSNGQSGLEWVLGYGWDMFTLLESSEDPLAAIDEALPTQPAAIMEQTSHAVWVNSLALTALGFSSETPDPIGGHIAKDPQGQPNGLLIDNAGDLAFELALSRSAMLDQQNYLGLLDGLEQLARNGITSFADARVYWSRGFHEFYARAETEGQMTARGVLGLWAYPQFEDNGQLAELTTLYHRDDTKRVQRSQIKVYVDGITQNTTARTLRPYLIDLGFGTPFGLNYFDEDRLAQYIIQLERVGYDFNIHAIGAGGVREALNAIQRARDVNPNITDARHRITHVELVHPDDIERFAALGVIADLQLAGDFTDPVQFRADSIPFIGADNPALPLPARALIDAGAVVTLSSDFDVSPLNPFLGLSNAVTRSQDSLSVEEAVDAYTRNAAFVMRQEDRLGSLEIGKRADFVVLDQNILSISPDRIVDTQVLMTVVDGEEVFRSRQF
ncbi:MAG: amidohydrolase [Pseudomonadota bacterium]